MLISIHVLLFNDLMQGVYLVAACSMAVPMVVALMSRKDPSAHGCDGGAVRLVGAAVLATHAWIADSLLMV